MMILKTIFIFCLTLSIFGAVAPVEEWLDIIHCQRVLDKEASFGHHSLVPMTLEERTHGYEHAFRYLWQKLTPPTSNYVNYVNIVRSLAKFVGWSRTASTVMERVGCSYDNLLTHIDRASMATEAPSASRNLTVAKARLIRLNLESRMAEKTLEAYDAADIHGDRSQMYRLLDSVMDGMGVKVRFIEMAQLISVCGYSPYGERSKDLDFARWIILRYFDVSPRTKRHFDMLGRPLPRAHAAPVSAPVPYVADDGEKQRANTTLADINAKRDAIAVALQEAAIAPIATAPKSPITVVLDPAETDGEEEVTSPPQKRRVALTNAQKENIERYLNAGWNYNTIAAVIGCSIHEVKEEESLLKSRS